MKKIIDWLIIILSASVSVFLVIVTLAGGHGSYSLYNLQMLEITTFVLILVAYLLILIVNEKSRFLVILNLANIVGTLLLLMKIFISYAKIEEFPKIFLFLTFYLILLIVRFFITLLSPAGSRS